MSVSHPLAGRRKQQTKGLCTLGARRIKKDSEMPDCSRGIRCIKNIRTGGAGGVFYEAKVLLCDAQVRSENNELNIRQVMMKKKRGELGVITSFMVSSEYMENSESCINQRVT